MKRIRKIVIALLFVLIGLGTNSMEADASIKLIGGISATGGVTANYDEGGENTVDWQKEFYTDQNLNFMLCAGSDVYITKAILYVDDVAKATITPSGSYFRYCNTIANTDIYLNAGTHTWKWKITSYINGNSNDIRTATTDSISFQVYSKPSVSSPSAKTVISDDTVSFSVTPNGGKGNYTYQWYYSTSSSGSGTLISGATSSTYKVLASKSMNGRYYYCVVKDNCADGQFTRSATSGRAKLTVYYVPTVTSPSSVTVENGNKASFSVSASGGNPSSYTYQWYYATSSSGSGTAISGATSSNYSLTASSSNAERYYYCVVNNSAGSVSSGRAKLTVTYKVAYNANGGSGAPSSQIKKHGTTLTLSTTKPTRSGYSFLGWGTSANDTSVDYDPGDSYTTNSDITLYAIWKANEYDVVFNANGGSGAPSSQIKKHGTTLTLSTTKPTRSGYSFLGWGTSANDTSVDYDPGDSYTTNSDITLYAIWKANEYDVVYDANGGSGAPSSQIKKHGITLTLSTTKPTRSGYAFQGWGTSANDTSVDYDPGDSYTTNSDITLYAIWKANEYNVSYNANGGSGAPSSQVKKHGTALTLSTTKPTRSGYTFQGWGTSANDTSVDYDPGDSYTTNSDITLYAIWKAKEYQVTYDANGGSGGPVNQVKKHDVALILSSDKPSRTGYTFRGWGTSANDTSVDYNPGDNYTTNSNITLYAIWKAKEYQVTYDANGGSGGPDSQIKKHGIELILSNEKPSRTGYIFRGWGTSANDTSVDYNPGDSYTTNSNITLYAIWKAKEYQVIYDANGGSNPPENQKKKHGVELILSNEKPTRKGYIFLGWGTSANDTSVDYNPGDSYTINSNIDLYAIWKIKEYEVTYDANGGYDAPESQKKKHGVELTLSNVKPTREGYTFRGWGISSDDTTVDYKAGAKYAENSNIELYAIWKLKEYKVTYDANGGNNAPEKQIKYHGEILILSDKKPTRNGYTFAGWATEKAATEAEYESGAEYFDNKAVKLYAVWNEKQVITAKNINKVVAESKRTIAINAKCKGNAKLTYKSNNKNITVNAKGKITIKKNYVGKATITITAAATEKYQKTTKKITVTVKPQKATINSLQNTKNTLVVKNKKNIGNVTYQIEYATNSKFNKSVKFSYIEYDKGGYVILKKPQKGKTYYVRIRGMKLVNKVTYYGAWSEVKKIKIK